MWLAQWIISAVVVAGSLVLALRSRAWSFLRDPKGKEKPTTAAPEKREAVYNELQGESPTLVEFDTPQMLLDMAVSLHDRKEAALAILDDKAQKLAALIAGGASLFVLLGGLDSKARIQLTPLLILSTLCFFAGLVLCLLALVPVRLEIPTVAEYNSGPILRDPAFRSKIARRLIEAWQEITLDLTPIIIRKARCVFSASVLTVAGATLLLTNFLVFLPAKPSSTSERIRCAASTSIRMPRQLTLVCEEPKV